VELEHTAEEVFDKHWLIQEFWSLVPDLLRKPLRLHKHETKLEITRRGCSLFVHDISGSVDLEILVNIQGCR